MSIYTRVSDSCSMKKLASTAPPQIQYTYVRFIYRLPNGCSTSKLSGTPVVTIFIPP